MVAYGVMELANRSPRSVGWINPLLLGPVEYGVSSVDLVAAAGNVPGQVVVRLAPAR